MDKIKIVALVAVVVVVVAAFAVVLTSMSDDENSDGSRTVVDFNGRKVVINSADRILSTSAVPTSILCGLGVSSSIVAVSTDPDVYGEDPHIIGATDDDFPKAIVDGLANKSIVALGGMYNMSAETIASVASDVVICDAYGIKQETMDALDQLGITYVVVSGTGLMSEIYDTIELLGKVVGKESVANRMISEMKNSIQKIQNWCKSVVENKMDGKKYNVAMMMTARYAIGPNYLGGEIMGQLYVNNVFNNIDRYALVTSESIVEANPDAIIFQNLGMGDGVTNPAAYIASVYADPILGGISAADNGLIFATTEGAKNAASYANQGIVRAYAMYAMFIYQDYLSFDVPDILNSSNYSQCIEQFWSEINS